MNWNTFGKTRLFQKHWHDRLMGVGSIPKIYHSSNPQHLRLQQSSGNIATDSSRGLYAIPPVSVHPAARSSSEGLKEPLSTAVIAMCLPTIAPGQSDRNLCRSWSASSHLQGPCVPV